LEFNLQVVCASGRKGNQAQNPDSSFKDASPRLGFDIHRAKRRRAVLGPVARYTNYFACAFWHSVLNLRPFGSRGAVMRELSLVSLKKGRRFET
jgi:hypothetical protein